MHAYTLFRSDTVLDHDYGPTLVSVFTGALRLVIHPSLSIGNGDERVPKYDGRELFVEPERLLG